MNRSIPLVLSLVLLTAATAPVVAEDGMLGFTEAGAEAQRALEERFAAALDGDEIREWIRTMSAHPHHVGSPWGRRNAELMVELFESWGYDARIEEFRVLFPVPRLRRVELLEPSVFRAALAEPPIEGDATSGQTDEQLPIYNAYSIDGDVTAELVYVNRGVPEDYEELERRGISVEGKIVIARYGGSWRGIKPKVAAEKGAIGCLLFTDPGDDGYVAGDAYPEGGYRPLTGAQRGSVADMPLYPGDPLTPGIGATADAERLELSETPTLTRIPVLPISAADARPLMAALGGPVAPRGWAGALPLTYHLGPGPARVRLQLEFDWELAPAWDVIARMEGSEHPDQWIVRGNHHDAWVNGATDPVSGMAAVLAEAKALAALARDGWRPKRTIVFAGWDAEEPGLLGSTEWAEHWAGELGDKAVVYINSDSNGRGFFWAGGSHTLEQLVNEVARDVTDPQTGVTVAERRKAAIALGDDDELRQQVEQSGEIPLFALGSGSDYSPFLQHLGIASLNIGFGGEGQYGQYHSVYDSFDHYRRFMDPEFQYGVALAAVGGRLLLRLANADLLPFEFTRQAATVGRYVDEVEKLAETMRDETAAENRRIEAGAHRLAWDPRETWVLPAPEEPVPFLNFAPLRNAQARLAAAAERYRPEAALALPGDQRAALDRVLYSSERALTRHHGLPGRPWYKHHVYAPGFYTGYGVKTLPGVREAIEQRQWQEAEEQIAIAAEVLAAAATAIERAVAAVDAAEDGAAAGAPADEASP